MKPTARALCVTAGLPGVLTFVAALRGEGPLRYVIGVAALIVGLSVCSLAVRR